MSSLLLLPPPAPAAPSQTFQPGSFSRAAVFQELLQHGPFPQGAVIQEQTAPVWIFPVAISPARKPVPAWAPLCGVTVSFRCIHLLHHGLPWAAGGSLLHHGLPGGQPVSLWAAWSTSSPSCFADRGACRVVSLSCSHSSLPVADCTAVFTPS